MSDSRLQQIAREFASKREQAKINAFLSHLETEQQRMALARYAGACKDLWTLIQNVLDRWNSTVKIFAEGEDGRFEASAFNVQEVGPGTESCWFMAGQGFGSGEFTLRCYAPNLEELRVNNHLVIGCARVDLGYAAWLWSPTDERGGWFKCTFKPGFYANQYNPELNKIYVSDSGCIDAASAFLYQSNVWNAAEIGTAVTDSVVEDWLHSYIASRPQ